MCNHQCGAPALEALQGLLDAGLVFGIDAGKRLVEDQDRRIFQERARDRQPLTLAAREAYSALADHCVVRVWQAHNEPVRVGGATGGV